MKLMTLGIRNALFFTDFNGLLIYANYKERLLPFSEQIITSTVKTQNYTFFCFTTSAEKTKAKKICLFSSQKDRNQNHIQSMI